MKLVDYWETVMLMLFGVAMGAYMMWAWKTTGTIRPRNTTMDERGVIRIAAYIERMEEKFGAVSFGVRNEGERSRGSYFIAGAFDPAISPGSFGKVGLRNGDKVVIAIIPVTLSGKTVEDLPMEYYTAPFDLNALDTTSIPLVD